MNKHIEILSSAHIDRKKWDGCVRSSSNPIIYAYSFYLDYLAENWHGIIVNDYEAVMPVAWKKKFGIRYSYRVPFLQQLGYFTKGNNNVQSELYNALFDFVRYGDYSFNYQNSRLAQSTEHYNFVLPLSRPYEEIASGYKKNLIPSLKKANKQNFIYQAEEPEVAISLRHNMYASRTPHVTGNDYNNFIKLCSQLAKKGDAFARKVSNEKKETFAIVLLLKDENRLYNMVNRSNEAGRKTEANYLLYDQVFREFAGKGLLFDFEGSDIPGIKSFYEKFGAVNQPYASIHFNDLPFPLHLLKR